MNTILNTLRCFGQEYRGDGSIAFIKAGEYESKTEGEVNIV
jgi:hypothetical protein